MHKVRLNKTIITQLVEDIGPSWEYKIATIVDPVDFGYYAVFKKEDDAIMFTLKYTK